MNVIHVYYSTFLMFFTIPRCSRIKVIHSSHPFLSAQFYTSTIILCFQNTVLGSLDCIWVIQSCCAVSYHTGLRIWKPSLHTEFFFSPAVRMTSTWFIRINGSKNKKAQINKQKELPEKQRNDKFCPNRTIVSNFILHPVLKQEVVSLTSPAYLTPFTTCSEPWSSDEPQWKCSCRSL